MTSRPSLSVQRARGETRAVALLCYGGKAKSSEPSRPWHLSAVRLRPFAGSLHRAAGGRGLEVATLRYRLRGWNGGGPALDDARWALDRLADAHAGVPIVLVGHSMGGRTALRLAGHPQVVGVVALAPWLDDSDPAAQLAGKKLLIVHGTADRWTSPAHSLAFARKAQALNGEVRRVELPMLGHFMLRRPRTWHGLTTETAVDWLGHALRPSSNPQSNTYIRRIGEAPSRLQIRL